MAPERPAREEQNAANSAQSLNVDENTVGCPGFEANVPIPAKHQAIEIMEAIYRPIEGDTREKRGPQNEGISLWLSENKEVNKTALSQFASNPKCCRKVRHLSGLGLSISENKGVGPIRNCNSGIAN